MTPGAYTLWNPAAGRYLSVRGRNLVLASAPLPWIFKQSGRNGFHIYANETDLLLDIDNANVAVGTTVKIWDYTGYDVQIWTVGQNANGTYYLLYAGNPRYCLGFRGSRAVLELRDPKNPMQEWKFAATGQPYDYLSITSINHRVELQLPSHVSGLISRNELVLWANRLETAYSSFYELTGYLPFSDIVVEAYKSSSRPNRVGWVIPGQNIIHIDRSFLVPELTKMHQRDNDWNFCALHEMGHLFDFGMPWNFEPEMMTDLKLAYVLEKHGAAASPSEFSAGTCFVGADIAQAYGRLASDFSVQYNIFGCVKRFLDIKDFIGWDPFRQTFHTRYHQVAAYASASGRVKLEAFIQLLSHYSGCNLTDYFSPGEWNAILRRVTR